MREAGLRAERVVVAGLAEDVRRLNCDLAFIAIHGDFGEDGVIQHLLTAAGIPFTGSSASCCGLTIDKGLTKEILAASDIPVPRGVTINNIESGILATQNGNLPYPLVVKPVNSGSSVGITIVKESTLLEEAIKYAQDFSEKTIIEEYVTGSEITAGLVGEEVLPLIELKSRRLFYDYAAKYEDADTEYLCPAPLTAAQTETLQALAGRVFTVTGVEHLGRVDIMLGSGGPRVLEVNTIPGFTSHSLLPMAAKAAGLPFPELCEKICSLAWHRARLRAGGKDDSKTPNGCGEA